MIICSPFRLAVLLIVLGCLPGRSAMAQVQAQTENVVRLASLDWPPFTGPHLPDQGRSTAIVQAALAGAGLDLQVDFLPWQRALASGLRDPDFQGYFPEYRDATMARHCLLSDPIGNSPLGFAERVDAPAPWRQLADLAGRRIGIVRGYVNNPEFDAMAAAGGLTVEPAVDDATNLRKLAAGRLDLVVIDSNVLSYLLATDPDLIPHRAALRLNARLLEEKSLHVCFRNDEAGTALRARFDESLRHLPEIQAEQNAARPDP
ncbi:transporter substrate-binding domain-containing protein [Niveispirillum sp. SYP-B3756]|uniref:substrate-binding periplasmic protein n=1 Tax=Niveispirillum sp. SYP-B3756 TaxID=2662178 RepID=UPI001290FE3E|nr:transporter substrate-binding domain-containing protein [Niveispirillum sp. SYP-B3756]MQP67115.1 transporter substrate-binding domain-containing protein [Niveispirillum sp. SYP-B3756]